MRLLGPLGKRETEDEGDAQQNALEHDFSPCVRNK
jgi:hypothetical protein